MLKILGGDPGGRSKEALCCHQKDLSMCGQQAGEASCNLCRKLCLII